jgi:nitroreductase
LNTIFTRRSVRNYQDKTVEPETLEKLLRAAMQAPSAGNQRPWEFIVVHDKELQEKLSGVNPYAKAIAKAPVSIVLLGNMKDLMFPQNWEMDMSACAQNLLLQAVDEGLGAVWLGVAPEEDRIEYVRGIFDLPDNVVPFCIIPVGYPEEGRGNRELDRFEASRIHRDKY